MNAIAISIIVVAVLSFFGGVLALVVSITGKLADARVAAANLVRDAAIEASQAWQAKAAAAETVTDDVIADNADYEKAKADAAKADADQTDLAGVVDRINDVLRQPLAGAQATSGAATVDGASVSAPASAAKPDRSKRPLRK